MKTEVTEIQETLKDIMREHLGPLRIRHDNERNFEVCGTFETMQGKQKVDGYYFASIMPKPKDVRLYFFPVYTHVDNYGPLPEKLNKALKGKSCFHIKKLDEELEGQIREMVAKGIELYKKDGLI
ncbi:MAG: hypothetical protein AAFY71_21340 [Bacteroidota bacterium]